MKNAYNIFGSKSSLDYDIMYYVEDIPAKQECKELCSRLEASLEAELPSKKRNVNLAIVENGEIVRVFKGTPDECNNSVFVTHHHHKQNHVCPVERVVSRNVPLKVARGLRVMLSFLSRTEHRQLVKAALKGTTSQKLAALRHIDFQQVEDLNKNGHDVVEFRKQAAFQIGQCSALMSGKELYTKEEVSEFLPLLQPYLFRDSSVDGSELNLYKDRFLDQIVARYENVEQISE